MSVRYYQFGKLVAGSSPSGPVIPPEASYGPPETINGTMAAATETITLTRPTKEILIRNTSDLASIEYSFDGGLTYLLLGPYGSSPPHAIQIETILLRDTAGGNPSYEIVAALGNV